MSGNPDFNRFPECLRNSKHHLRLFFGDPKLIMNSWSVKCQRLMFIWSQNFPCEHGKRSYAYSFSTESVIFSSKLIPFPRLGRRWRPKLQGATLTSVLYEPWTLINHHLYLDTPKSHGQSTVSGWKRRRCVIPLFLENIFFLSGKTLCKKMFVNWRHNRPTEGWKNKSW